MTNANGERTYQFRALTDLWTGSIMDRNGHITDKPTQDRLITTGLLGSIRWWFEVLVRGLGGSACDPTDTKCEDRNHCVVCELFGCTGWARKFRFEVLDENSGTKTDQIKQNETFSLRFTPLRPIRDEEWALLDATLRLIADYGAIGGKTVSKPSEQNSRDQHKDYGLMKFVESPKISIPRNVLQEYISQDKWRKLDHGEFAWASLQHFWCVNGKYLARQKNGNSSSFNCIIGRPEPKQQSGQNDSWIAGRRPDTKKNIEAESKKVFSFKNPPRTFGFIETRDDAHWNDIRNSLSQLDKWRSFDPSKDFLTADQILKKLFKSDGTA